MWTVTSSGGDYPQPATNLELARSFTLPTTYSTLSPHSGLSIFSAINHLIEPMINKHQASEALVWSGIHDKQASLALIFSSVFCYMTLQPRQ